MSTSSLYQIKIKGHLDLHWSDWFDGLVITHEPNGVTLLTGQVVDQLALFGLLLKIRNLNLTLLSLQQLGSDPPATPRDTID